MDTKRSQQIGAFGFVALAFASGLSGIEMGPDDGLSLVASAQTLVMERDFGQGVEGSSASASLTLDLQWDATERLQFDGQFVQVNQLYQRGRSDAAYWLSNDDMSLLNGVSLAYDFSHSVNTVSVIKLGRLADSYDFFPAYKVRHKAQAFEGVVWKGKLANGVAVDAGHIERFSSWSCREGGPSAVTSDFLTMSDRFGRGTSDSGVQFVSSSYQSGKYSLTGYDYYADDFYNNVGFKCSRTFESGDGKGVWSVQFHYDRQDGVSDTWMPDHEADCMELGFGYKQGGLSWDAGWTRIGSSGSLLVPFRTSHAVDATLLWYTNQFEADTSSFHWKGTFKKGPWVFYSMLLQADHVDRSEREMDVVVKYSFENRFWLAFKGGYGERYFDAAGRDDQWARDLRLFSGISF